MSARCRSTGMTRRRTAIWGSLWRKRERSRKPSSTTSRPCGLIPISPRRTPIWEWLWRKRERSQEAIPHYEQALRIHPDYAEAHTDLGAALAQTGRIEEAILHYEQALRIQSRFRRGALQSGDRFGANGKDRGSHPALRAGPADQARFRRGALQSGDRFGANGKDRGSHRSTSSRPCGSSPISPRRTTIWGSLWRKRARSRKPSQHFEQALRIKPDYAEAHYDLGIALAQTGKIEEAIAALRAGPADQTRLCRGALQSGDRSGQAGRTPEAIGHLKQALRIKPDFTQAQSALARLQARR